MQSLHSNISLTKSSSFPSIPPTKLSSPSSGVQFLGCKILNNGKEKHAHEPMISQRHLLTRRNVGFRAHNSQKGSENYLAFEDPQSIKPSKRILETFQEKLDVFNRFVWAELVMNKMWSVISISLLALDKLSDLSPSFLVVMCKATVAVGLMIIYVSGLNQITDVEIDKVNRPKQRPLVTGEISMTTGVIIVSSSVIMSFLLGWNAGSGPLLCSLFVGFAIGTIYSVDVPFLRWKRNPLAAAFSMLCLQILWPIGIYLHIQTFVLGQPALLSKALIVMTVYLSILAVAQTLFKDIPDIEGDRLDGNQTLPVRFGAEKVFWSCIGMVQFAYLLVVLAGLTYPNIWSKFMIVGSHMLLSSILWRNAMSVDLKNQASQRSFYVFIWRLVAFEYVLIHLLR